MIAFILIVASILAGPLPPNLPLPIELEVCILKAELCASTATCGEVDIEALETCIENYETCSYSIPEAHEPNCRTEHVWCALELPFQLDNQPFADHCDEVNKLCPST